MLNGKYYMESICQSLLSQQNVGIRAPGGEQNSISPLQVQGNSLPSLSFCCRPWQGIHLGELLLPPGLRGRVGCSPFCPRRRLTYQTTSIVGHPLALQWFQAGGARAAFEAVSKIRSRSRLCLAMRSLFFAQSST